MRKCSPFISCTLGGQFNNVCTKFLKVENDSENDGKMCVLISKLVFFLFFILLYTALFN